MEMYQKSLDIRKEKPGERHLSIANLCNKIGNVLYNQMKYDEAMEMYQEAHGIWKEKLGERHRQVAQTYFDMGGLVLERQVKYKEAMEMFRQALRI